MIDGFRVSWERLTKFHAWSVGGTRFGWNDEAGRWHWNGNFEFRVGPLHVSYIRPLAFRFKNADTAEHAHE